MKKTKKAMILTVVTAMMLSFTACGSSSAAFDKIAGSTNSMDFNSYADSAYSTNGYYNEAYESDYDYGTEPMEGEKFNDSARKLIKTYSVDVETENFDDFIGAVEERIVSLGGYIQDLNTYNGSSYTSYKSARYSNMTVRIPISNLERFVEYIGDSANIKSKNLNVEDVTLEYVDTESRKETYEIEQERLLALLEKADNIEDMITIESRLSEVRYKLESQASQLRLYDNLVDYATVNLSVNEVKKVSAPEPVSYGEQVLRAFTDGLTDVWEGLKSFFIGFMGALPSLVLFAIIVTIVVFVVKAISKSSKKKKASKHEKAAMDKMEVAKLKAEEKAKNNAE